MSGHFRNYANTPTGANILSLSDDPERMVEYRVLSENGKPAVQALAQDVAPIINALSDKVERDMASQFVGWAVGQLMRAEGYEIVQERGRVSDAPYKTGAVWGRQRIEPKFVRVAPQTGSHGQLRFFVSRVGESVFADWELVSNETSPITGQPRRVHKILSPKKSVAVAAKEALNYAKRHGICEIWLKDPEKLFSYS